MTLNLWGGKIHDPLMAFLKRTANDTDVFCFQELSFPNLASEIGKILADFSVFTHPAPVKKKIGQGIFVKKHIPVTEHGGFSCFPHITTANFNYVVVRNMCIGNLHGLMEHHTKLDTPHRIEQSLQLEEFLVRRREDKILVGDFNELPKTHSMMILEHGMRDLDTEFGLSSTRTKYYTGTHHNHLSDYILVSPGIVVRKFEMLSDEVSDHAALMLDIDS